MLRLTSLSFFFAVFGFACLSPEPGSDAGSTDNRVTHQAASDSAIAAEGEGLNNDEEATERTISLEGELPLGIERLTEAWIGDLDGMVERRAIRLLTVYSDMGYFLDGLRQRGIVYEMAKQFEEAVNKRMGIGTIKVDVFIVPVTRDQLIPALVAGRGDIAAANLTVTPERLAQVDFSNPILTDVDEIVVTGPAAPALETLDDLSGQQIYVRKSSSYYESLLRLNQSFQRRGIEEMQLLPASEFLEDEDLLQMVSAGLLPMAIVDSHKAEFWAQIFDRVTPRSDLAVNTGGQIAWAFRKDTPQLREAIDEFVATHKKGTLMGNIVLKRYLRSTKWVENSLATKEQRRFETIAPLLQQYAAMYDFDWLLIAAQAYQESRLDQSLRSPVGAIGVMQLMPSTAGEVGITNIESLENNIQAGVKYLRYITDTYLADEELDEVNRHLFAFASYNAGPSRVRRLRRTASQMGLDPNEWFYGVEVVAGREIGRETVQYVSNISKYYVAYAMIAERFELEATESGGDTAQLP